MIGEKLGHYEITAEIGSGGMGQVYRAHDARLERDVAVKILLANARLDPASVSRFFREARAASALNHPNIITIHDIGEMDSGQYIVMEIVEGQTLRRLMTGAL